MLSLKGYSQRLRLGDVAELKNVKLEPMMHKVTNVDCYY
jgi:hypothetical protein